MTSSALLTRSDAGGLPPTPPPRFATARDHGRPTLGPAVARVAAALGTPLMPWQRMVADVAGEVDPAGRPVYPLVVVTVPRQSGKTTLDLAQSVQRCLYLPNRRVWHTAQTGQDARQKWGELVDAVLASPLRQLVAGRPRRTNGAEALEFVNGSRLRPHPPTRDALHGQQSDTANVDEAWAFDEAQGQDLFQAIVPTQATRPGAQTFVWSTAGDRTSTWFRGLVNRGRSADAGLAYFEWSIPDDADPMDLGAVAAAHPAYGHTISLDSLRAAQVTLGDRPGEFARAYGNRWTGAGERVLPIEAWQAATTTAPVPPGRPAYGVAVSRDGAWGSLYAAVLDDAGVPTAELVERRPGRSWLVDRVLALADPGAGVAIDRRGPAAPVADQLALATSYKDGRPGGALTLLEPTGPDYPAACQDLYDRVTADPAPRVRHRACAELDEAADVTGRRIVGDGAWVWVRNGLSDPLEAYTLAVWALLRQAPPEPAPFVAFYPGS